MLKLEARPATKENLDIRLKELELKLQKWQSRIGLAAIMANGSG